MEACIDTIDGIAEEVYVALQPWKDLPLAFFGHSMGATLAFEVARLFEDRDKIKLSALFLSGRRAPSRLRHEAVHIGGDDAIVAELRQLSGTDDAFLADDDVLRMILPAVRADYKAIESYCADMDASVECPIIVLVGDNDPKTSVEEARDWAQHTKSTCRTNVFSGGHFYLSVHQRAVIEIVEDFLQIT